jgi:hypothetical protein
MKIPFKNQLGPIASAFLLLLWTGPAFAYAFVLPENLSESDRKRFGRFETFQIKGVCGDSDLERLAKLGVNTVRGYTIPDSRAMRKKLDQADRLGLKVIVSEWMPHHGENKNKEGVVWKFDYEAQGDKMVSDFMKKVEGIGDHPALLMWGLGNEVHLDEPYLRVANRMSEEIHKRFPHHITSLTMVNAKPEHIEAVKKFAPDIDVLGIQSYSSGAVRGAIKKTGELWGKPFYMSEFNANGPWNMKKTGWDVPLDEPVTKKVGDLMDCYAAIDASPLCLGSTAFVWGHFKVDDRPTYFSLLLDPDPEGTTGDQSFGRMLMTPQADAMVEHFTGQPVRGNRAPALSKLEFEGGARSRSAQPGEKMPLDLAAGDADGDRVDFVTWILKSKVRKTTSVAGPLRQPSGEEAVVEAPQAPGEYLVMVYAIDNKGGGSASVLPFQVVDPAAEPPPPPAKGEQP